MRGEEGGPVEGETDPTVDQEVGVCLGVEAGRDGMPAETGGPVGHGAERGGAGAERGGDIVESGGNTMTEMKLITPVGEMTDPHSITPQNLDLS